MSREGCIRLGVVSFLNARPLVAGLEHAPGVTLVYDVPSRLPGLLEAGRVDAALVPVVDLMARGDRWQLVSDACIGCDGETYTVRVFSRCEPSQVTRLHVDGDSHTSVMLARVIWREMFGVDLAIEPWGPSASGEGCEAVLLIGDKVVSHRRPGLDHEFDLGAAWKALTGLPFVFAVWAAPTGAETTDLAAMLAQARDRGVRSAEMIAGDVGPGLGWPVELARRYLTMRLKFHLGPRQHEAMRRFFDYASRLSETPVRGEAICA